MTCEVKSSCEVNYKKLMTCDGASQTMPELATLSVLT